jgi:cell division protein FtsL
MKKTRIALLYFLMGTMPLLFGALAWQSGRYSELEKETANLEAVQEDHVAANRRLISEIALLSSAGHIEKKARDQGLVKKKPEEVLQINITGGYRPNAR